MRSIVVATLSALAIASAGALAQDVRSGTTPSPQTAPPGAPPPTFPQTAPPVPASPGLGTTPHTAPPSSPGMDATNPSSPTGATGGRPSVDRPMTDPRLGGRISETAPNVQQPPLTRRGPERFREDLAQCDQLQGDARAACRSEMFAARQQGLYK